MSATGLPDESFDAVISVFSVFFVADMEAQIAELWRMLRQTAGSPSPSGAEMPFSQALRSLAKSLCRLRPDLAMPKRPWERLSDLDTFERLLLDGRATEPEITVIDDKQVLSCVDDWWTIAMGSGYRWEIEQLASRRAKQAAPPDQQTLVRSGRRCHRNKRDPCRGALRQEINDKYQPSLPRSDRGRVSRASSVKRRRATLREMRDGPSRSAVRCGPQTAASGCC